MEIGKDEDLTEKKLMRLTKRQLISFILNKLKEKNKGGPKVSVSLPPVDFDEMKLPGKPPLIPPAAVAPPAPGGTKPVLKTPPPVPKTPPPVPGHPSVAQAPRKSVVPREKVTGKKKIFVKCERCDRTFIIDLPKHIVLSNPLEVVPVTILHHDQHALTVYLDQNFESRRDYISEIFVLKNYDPVNIGKY